MFDVILNGFRVENNFYFKRHRFTPSLDGKLKIVFYLLVEKALA